MDFNPNAEAFARVAGQPRYQPFIHTADDGKQTLIQVWFTPEGLIDSIQYAHRDASWLSWGLPNKAVKSW